MSTVKKKQETWSAIERSLTDDGLQCMYAHLSLLETDGRRHVGYIPVDQILLQERRDRPRLVLNIDEEAVTYTQWSTDIKHEQFVGRLLVRGRHHARVHGRQDELVDVQHEGAREGRLGRQVGEGASDRDRQVDVLPDGRVRLHRVEDLHLERQIVDLRGRRAQVTVLPTTCTCELAFRRSNNCYVS